MLALYARLQFWRAAASGPFARLRLPSQEEKVLRLVEELRLGSLPNCVWKPSTNHHIPRHKQYLIGVICVYDLSAQLK
jgi:hypothetical protein